MDCQHTFPPNSNNVNEMKCNELWGKAHDLVRKFELETSFEKADQIRIDYQKQPSIICYNPKTYQSEGWCETEGGGWGICGPACNLDDTNPEVGI